MKLLRVENFNGVVQVSKRGKETRKYIQREGAGSSFSSYLPRWTHNFVNFELGVYLDNDNAKLSREMKTEMKVSKRRLFHREHVRKEGKTLERKFRSPIFQRFLRISFSRD